MKDNMSDISNRIKLIRKEKNLTQTDFGKLIGVTKQAISNIEGGYSNPSLELLSQLFKNFYVNLNWLITGEGEMFNTQQPSVSDDELEQKVVEVMKKFGVIGK